MRRQAENDADRPMNEQVRIIGLTDREEWLEQTRGSGLPSQSWAYANGLSASGIKPQLAVVNAAGARMLLPFHERTWQETVDISTFVGPSGASIFPSSPAPLSLWREYAASRGWVAGYIQLSSLVQISAPAGAEFICNNADFIIPTRSENFIKSASRTIRTKYHDAVKAGAMLEADRTILLARLQELYPASMQRLGAPAHFLFSSETLRRWSLDDEAMLLGTRIGDRIEAVLLLRITGSNAEALIFGSTDNGRHLMPWLFVQATARLRPLGVEFLNMGGGVRKDDGVYRWKERFHVMQRPRWAVRQIYNRSKFDHLCERAGVSQDSGWFPPYRRTTN
jgi:hypothetical protein